MASKLRFTFKYEENTWNKNLHNQEKVSLGYDIQKQKLTKGLTIR